jgi:hypothetical protein
MMYFRFRYSLLELRLYLHLRLSQSNDAFISISSPHTLVRSSRMASIRAGVAMDELILVIIQVIRSKSGCAE